MAASNARCSAEWPLWLLSPSLQSAAITTILAGKQSHSMARNTGGGGIAGLGLVGLLFLVGIVLFLFPEPATSGIGMTLIIIGVIVFLVQQFL